MNKRHQRTKVLINGEDVSNFVTKVNIEIKSGSMNTVDLHLVAPNVSVDDQGTIVVSFDTKEDS